MGKSKFNLWRKRRKIWIYILGYLNDNKNNDGFFAGVKLVVPLGDVNKKKPEAQTETLQYVSVREKLYIPVKRENRIRVVKISNSGVKVSGF